MIMKHLKTRGAAMILFVLFFAFASSALMFALGQSIFSDLSDFNRLTQAKQAFLTSESLTEDVVYRLVFGTFELDEEESLTLGGVIAYSTTTYDSPADIFLIETQAQLGSVLRKSQAEMSIGAGSSFNYGLQAGNGGIAMDNGSRIIGNVYSNGPVIGANRSDILGDVVSAGPLGLVKDVHATGTVRAHSIDDIETDVAAYYTVDVHPTEPMASDIPVGERYTPVPDMATTSFPISTTTVQEWKDAIVDHGTVFTAADCASQPTPGLYVIDISTTIGYLKIECDLDIEETGGDIFITLDGPVWVEGNISFTQGPTIQVDPDLGRRSVQIIADKPSDRITSSQIEIRNSTDFIGSGDSRSYIMLMSLNESASLSGTEAAIDISQSANGSMIAYSDLGLVSIGNGIDLREITGYQIDVAQNTDVYYEEGLASLLFTSGPGGGYLLNDWQQAE